MPLTRLSFTCTSAPAEAREWVAPLVAREPLWLSIIATNIEEAKTDPARYENPRWWVGRDPAGRGAVAAFMHTPPHPLHVGFATPDQARDLAAALHTEGESLAGVGGMRGPAAAFAEQWRQRTGSDLRTVMELGVYDLSRRPKVPFEVPGHCRRATLDDLALADGWAADFHIEFGSPGPAPSMRQSVEAGRLGLWVDPSGSPVSMAYARGPNGGVTRVSGVWTPPDQRAHGYASAVVAAVSAERMGDGERCMLYTDLANRTSNGIYQALGYRQVGDSITLAFE